MHTQTRKGLSSNHKNYQIDTNEEFAKLDALLADLLSEVEQPLLLNQEGTIINWEQNGKATTKETTNCEILKNLDDIERSVDYLNEQKEKLKSKKNFYNQKGTNDVIFEEEDQESSSYNQPFRKIKSKFDYYISNSNDQSTDSSNKQALLNKQGYPLSNSNSLNKLHKPFINYQKDNSSSNEQSQSLLLSEVKPPLSPQSLNQRGGFIPNFHPSHPSSTQFHSISINNTTKVETDDDFDCASMKSGISTASTVQRSKYHTISNNYVESTGPQYSSARYLQNKRAFSAPPADLGKIVLQRIELKSPLTIKNASTLSFPQNSENGSLAMPNNLSNQNKQVHNRYNNRNVLKINTLQPQRGIRALSERPQNIGYDTDTGVMGYNHRGYNYRHNNNSRNDADFDSDIEAFKQSSNRTYSNNIINRRYIDPNGYDTDTGLINARKCLNQRLFNSKYDTNVLNSATNIEPNFTTSARESSTTRLNNNVNINSNFKFHNSNNMVSPISNNETIRYGMDGPVFEQNKKNEENKEYRINNGDLHIDSRVTKIQNKCENKEDIDGLNKSAFHSLSSKRNAKTSNASSIGVNESQNDSNNLLLIVNSQVFDNNTKNVKKVNNNSANSRSSSVSSINDVPDALKPWRPVHDTQSFWYKPKISREDAINLLKDKPPGTFLIRDSNNFPGAYGLALKVEKLPPNIPIKANSDQSAELVRHFLIEPTSGGVRIKGCCNEPVFTNLAALVHQHSITPLALPCRLILPTSDLLKNSFQNTTHQQLITNKIQQKNTETADSSISHNLLERGAACHVYYLNSTNVENSSGTGAINKAIESINHSKTKDNAQLILIQFKVNSNGIFITDINRKRFVRNHFPTETVLFCAIDDTRVWPNKVGKIEQPRIFGIVSKSQTSGHHNECHLFVELDQEQPAIAIVDFINRYLIPSKTKWSQNEQ